AVERLREFLSRRGVTVGASGLALALSANAVQSAPLGLATTSTSAALTGAALHSVTTIGTTKALAMTTLQKIAVTATITAAVGVGIYESRQAAQTAEQLQALQQRHAPMKEQLSQVSQERDQAAAQLAAVREENETLRASLVDLPKLRGEVARLRENARDLA